MTNVILHQSRRITCGDNLGIIGGLCLEFNRDLVATNNTKTRVSDIQAFCSLRNINPQLTRFLLNQQIAQIALNLKLRVTDSKTKKYAWSTVLVNDAIPAGEKRFLPKETALAWIRDADRHGVRYVNMSGGETLCYPFLEELIRDTERRAAAVLRYSDDHRLIDSTHTYMGWMFEFTGDYAKAREHILQLPAYASFQGQGNMLAQLELFENGFPAELEQIDRNLESLSDVICNDLERAMRDITQYADEETEKRYRSWMMDVARAFGQLPAVRTRWALCEKRLLMQAEMRSAGTIEKLDNTLPLSIKGTRK